MNETNKLKMVFREAYEFLISKVGEDVLIKELEHYTKCSPRSLQDVFKQMVQTLKNKQGHNRYIADVRLMEGILKHFNAPLVVEYHDWKKLFEQFRRRFGNVYTMDQYNQRNAWVMYSKGVLSCARFLTNFQTAGDFIAFVQSFTSTKNEFLVAALPMVLEKEIYGYGFPLACDFLKEMGFREYGKPDVHLKEIFLGLELVGNDTDYEVFKMIVKIGKAAGRDPVDVDKVFWMIGSGRFEASGHGEIGRQKKKFVEMVRRKIS